MSNLDHRHLLELKEKIEGNEASSDEKKEYVTILYENGSLTQKQYRNYLNGQYTDEIINTALTLGAIIIGTWLILEVLKKV